VKPLGKNNGGYFGELIDAESVLEQLALAASSNGWKSEVIQLESEFGLHAYTRLRNGASQRVYISAGIHGDEPAGPLALLSMIKQNEWPEDLDLYMCPLLNPSGFPLNTRENGNKLDLNRDYRHLKSLEVQTHTHWLLTQPRFDVALCLHEDWEARGFYLYELNPGNGKSLAPAILNAVREECPIDSSELIDEWEATDGLIRPNVKPEERELWAEAVFLIAHKTEQTYTLETPSDFTLDLRIRAHVRAVKAALRELCNP
jgi:protein MpaA